MPSSYAEKWEQKTRDLSLESTTHFYWFFRPVCIVDAALAVKTFSQLIPTFTKVSHFNHSSSAESRCEFSPKKSRHSIVSLHCRSLIKAPMRNGGSRKFPLFFMLLLGCCCWDDGMFSTCFVRCTLHHCIRGAAQDLSQDTVIITTIARLIFLNIKHIYLGSSFPKAQKSVTISFEQEGQDASGKAA